MREHTPGPWIARGGCVETADGTCVAEADVDCHDDDKRIADAALIAAAPDLLDAARLSHLSHGHLLRDAAALLRGEQPDMVLLLLQKAAAEDAAIAKAGERE